MERKILIFCFILLMIFTSCKKNEKISGEKDKKPNSSFVIEDELSLSAFSTIYKVKIDSTEYIIVNNLDKGVAITRHTK